MVGSSLCPPRTELWKGSKPGGLDAPAPAVPGFEQEPTPSGQTGWGQQPHTAGRHLGCGLQQAHAVAFPKTRVLTKQRAVPRLAATEGPSGIQARPRRTHLRGMRRNCRFSSCSCRTRWASCAVSRPVRLWADTIWMFSRSAERERQSPRCQLSPSLSLTSPAGPTACPLLPRPAKPIASPRAPHTPPSQNRA